MCFTGLTKPVVFGFIVATIGCYYGITTKGGTQGVGRATTEAVVAAMILIIAVDVFITRVLMLTLGTSSPMSTPTLPIEIRSAEDQNPTPDAIVFEGV